mmetsp:Transcript_63982/g.73403  ORF Transcript_63982/g.73403 Transcript_63982/m.73403 type:complete len:567 (+) Transcript_63982:46-1746(+)
MSMEVSDAKLLRVFLRTKFQFTLEEYKRLYYMPADETTPFVHKYEARALLDRLSSHPLLQLPEEKDEKAPEDVYVAQALINYYIGLNFNETEEISDSEKTLARSLEYFTQISKERKLYFLTTLQDLLNNLGIIYVNREDVKKGVRYFGKSSELYKILMALEDFPKSKFYIETTNNRENSESYYTLTLFYLAQVYSQTNQKDKASEYCTTCLKRQYEMDSYELKDWIINALSMSDYYMDNMKFAQAEYLLRVCLDVLPKDEEKRKKLRAHVWRQLGKVNYDRLQFFCEQRKSGCETPGEGLQTLFNTQSCLFNQTGKGGEAKWQDVKVIDSYEEAKECFKAGRVWYEKSLTVFVIDGYVTDYIDIVQKISGLYLNLAAWEGEIPRLIAMHSRRLTLVEPLAKDINEKAYINVWQQLMTEIGDIHNDIFELKLLKLQKRKKAPKQEVIDEMNDSGRNALTAFTKLLSQIEELDKEERSDQTWQSILNLKFSMARLYSRLVESDYKTQIENVKMSLDYYSYIRDELKKKEVDGSITRPQREQLQLCSEMCGLIPAKISKINAQERPIYS